MVNQVYANMMEVSCKAAAGKSICAFPDVCFTPPQTPATPPGVPIPYPNTGMASDCTSGSTTVKISNQEVMLKNKSYFKRSMGDEAGCAPKKGVITSKNTGKVYFTKWSMDVKVEGENVVRHFDLTTHNHASQAGQTPPQLYADSLVPSATSPDCQKLGGAMKAEIEHNLPPSMRPRPASDATGKSSTLAVAKIQGTPGGLMAGHSMVATNRITRGGQFAHYSDSVAPGETSNVKPCGSDEPFEYADDPARPKQGHAEAKIIEDWFKGGSKGTLVLKISRPPCPDCTRLINEVNKGKDGKGECNKIKVCDDSGGA
jgi:hypothetical protein